MIILVKEGNSYNTVIKEYEAVTNSDKANFDVSNAQMGTKLHVIEDDKYYILNSSHEWVETSYGGQI